MSRTRTGVPSARAGRPAVAARPNARARSAVSLEPTSPRTPSVPKSLRAKARLALGELRPLAGLLQACLLALLGARVARQVAAALQLATQVRVGLQQSAGDAVAQRAVLSGHAAAGHRRDDVHAVLV